MNTNDTFLEQTMLDNLATFLSQEKLKDLLNRYLTDSQQIIEQLKGVLTQKDSVEVTRLVHSLKSTSANVGAARLSELAKSLEALAREERLEEISTQMDELTGLFAGTQADIEQLDVMQG